MKTKEELQKEQQELAEMGQQLDQKKNEILTRLIEIQGVLKYLEDKEKK